MVASIQDKQKNKIATLFRAYLAEIEKSNFTLHPYSNDTRIRDAQLLVVSRSEPILSSVLATVVSRDKNRSWSLIGGSRKVAKFGNALHNLNDGEGWRHFVSSLSNSYYSTNLGYAAEIGTNTLGIPETMWSFDPTRVRLLGFNDEDGRMGYYGSDGLIPMKRYEYIHGNSMPSVEEVFKGAGYCAVERALSFARIMMGLVQYQLEKLNVAPAKGIAMFKGITDEEFKQAVANANEEAKNGSFDFYKGILSIFTDNTDAEIDLKGFSELPDNFILKEFIEIIVQAYALAFGYGVGEFWSISSGSFGRTGEMKVQEQMSTAKGELEFALSLQEQVQKYFLPPSVQFAFDVRNDSGDLVRQEVVSKKIANIIAMYQAFNKQSFSASNPNVNPETGKPLAPKNTTDEDDDSSGNSGARDGDGDGEIDEETERIVLKLREKLDNVDGIGIIDREEARQLLVDEGILPAEWTSKVEDEETTDLTELRYRAKYDMGLMRSARENPNEPIVMYRWNAKRDFERGGKILRMEDLTDETISHILDSYYPKGDVLVLFEKGSELYKRKY